VKQHHAIWIAILLAPFFLPTSTPAYDLDGERRSPILSLQLMVEVQERDVLNKGIKIKGFKFEGNATSTRFLVRAGVRPIRFIEIYGLVGGADLKIDDFNGFDTRLNVASGGGVLIILFESTNPESLNLFLDTRYLRFVAQDHVETLINGTTTPQDEEIRWNEFEAKIGVDSRYLNLRPYGGLRASFIRAEDILSITGELDIEEDDNVGIFGGVDIYLDPTESVALNLELNLFDVNAFRAGLLVVF
jgi:hypothetical protein